MSEQVFTYAKQLGKVALQQIASYTDDHVHDFFRLGVDLFRAVVLLLQAGIDVSHFGVHGREDQRHLLRITVCIRGHALKTFKGAEISLYVDVQILFIERNQELCAILNGHAACIGGLCDLIELFAGIDRVLDGVEPLAQHESEHIRAQTDQSAEIAIRDLFHQCDDRILNADYLIINLFGTGILCLQPGVDVLHFGIHGHKGKDYLFSLGICGLSGVAVRLADGVIPVNADIPIYIWRKDILVDICQNLYASLQILIADSRRTLFICVHAELIDLFALLIGVDDRGEPCGKGILRKIVSCVKRPFDDRVILEFLLEGVRQANVHARGIPEVLDRPGHVKILKAAEIGVFQHLKILGQAVHVGLNAREVGQIRNIVVDAEDRVDGLQAVGLQPIKEHVHGAFVRVVAGKRSLQNGLVIKDLLEVLRQAHIYGHTINRIRERFPPIKVRNGAEVNALQFRVQLGQLLHLRYDVREIDQILDIVIQAGDRADHLFRVALDPFVDGVRKALGTGAVVTEETCHKRRDIIDLFEFARDTSSYFYVYPVDERIKVEIRQRTEIHAFQLRIDRGQFLHVFHDRREIGQVLDVVVDAEDRTEHLFDVIFQPVADRVRNLIVAAAEGALQQ